MAAVTMHFKKSQKHRKVHAGELHLMQKVQCEKDRRLQGVVRKDTAWV